jgi:hypothetical protein
MSETDEFWQYAREAMLSVGYAKTDEESDRACADLDASGIARASTSLSRPAGTSPGSSLV